MSSSYIGGRCFTVALVLALAAWLCGAVPCQAQSRRRGAFVTSSLGPGGFGPPNFGAQSDPLGCLWDMPPGLSGRRGRADAGKRNDEADEQQLTSAVLCESHGPRLAAAAAPAQPLTLVGPVGRKCANLHSRRPSAASDEFSGSCYLTLGESSLSPGPPGSPNCNCRS